MRSTVRSRRRLLMIAAFVLALLVMMIPACGGHDENVVVIPFTTILPVGLFIDDAVAFFGLNYYSARVTPGELYKISITSLSDDADLLVFGRDATFTFLARCAIDNTIFSGTVPEGCVIRATGGVLYFGVDGSSLSSSFGIYTIGIELLTTTDLNLSIPFSDTIARTSAAVYAVPFPSAGTYTVSITGLNDDADLYVFGTDGTFTTQVLCSGDNLFFPGTAPEDCTFTSGGGTVYFIVDGLFSSAANVTYTALLAPAPDAASPVNEGSIAAPVNVNADVPFVGQVGTGGESFYTAGGLLAGRRYTISIAGLTNNANLTVFGSDNTFTAPAVCIIDNTFFTLTTPEGCTLVAGTTLYFTVSAAPNASAYVVLVEPGP